MGPPLLLETHQVSLGSLAGQHVGSQVGANFASALDLSPPLPALPLTSLAARLLLGNLTWPHAVPAHKSPSSSK